MSTLAEIEAAMAALDENEQRKLLHYLNARLQSCSARQQSHGTNLMELAGTIHLREDPLEGQQRLRAEWK